MSRGTQTIHRRFPRACLLVALLLAGPLLASCTTLYRYQVVRVPVEDCIIRPNGEFCDEEADLPPPSVQVWSLEVDTQTEHTILYIGEETWVASGIDGQRVVEKESRVSRNNCTTTTTRRLLFEEDGQTISGSLEEKVRVEGPESCGDAPFGDRRRWDFTGETGPLL